MNDDINFRSMSDYERRVVDMLLRAEFPGRDELRKQFEQCQVRTIDEDGSIEIQTLSNLGAPVVKRVPVEGYAEDSDGVMIHVLLHVKDSTAREIEFYKDDSSRILSRPSDWTAMTLP